jgi:hypothetical protein
LKKEKETNKNVRIGISKMQILANDKWLKGETLKKMNVLIIFNFNKSTIEDVKENLRELDKKEKYKKSKK